MCRSPLRVQAWAGSGTVQYCNFKRSCLKVSASLDTKSSPDVLGNMERSSMTALPLRLSQVVAVLRFHVTLRKQNGSSQGARAIHTVGSAAGTCLNDVHTSLWLCVAISRPVQVETH